MFIFGLCSISDDQTNDPSMNIDQTVKKRPPKSSKKEMFFFGLHSISGDLPGNLSDEH